MGPLVWDADDYERVPKRLTVNQRGHRVKGRWSEETRDRVEPIDRLAHAPVQLPNPDPIYRMTLGGTLALLTLDLDERDDLVADDYLWQIIGYGYPLGTEETGLVPLYRSFHAGSSDHLFTVDADEHANAVNSLGYTAEDSGIYVFLTAASNRVPVYRALRSALHYYSSDFEEIQVLAAAGWVSEGVQFYVLRNEERTVTR